MGERNTGVHYWFRGGVLVYREGRENRGLLVIVSEKTNQRMEMEDEENNIVGSFDDYLSGWVQQRSG
jgi:hypothetical protein